MKTIASNKHKIKSYEITKKIFYVLTISDTYEKTAIHHLHTGTTIFLAESYPSKFL